MLIGHAAIRSPDGGSAAQTGTDAAGHPLFQRNFAAHTEFLGNGSHSLKHSLGTAGIDDVGAAFFQTLTEQVGYKAMMSLGAIIGSQKIGRASCRERV